MKKKFITWFTGLIAAEVAKLDTSLQNERAALIRYLCDENEKLAKLTTDAAKRLEARSQELLKDFEEKLIAEASVVVGEKNQLIAELHTKIASLEQTARKITHWKADSSTVEADHSLKW